MTFVVAVPPGGQVVRENSRWANRMNRNTVVIDTWSNDASKRLYELGWPEEPSLKQQYVVGDQCGGCSFYAGFNPDFGLCCNLESRHSLESVFEHFTCPSFIREGWGPHSFKKDTEFHCRCGGEPKGDPPHNTA